jgi:hypothetical protein
MAATGGMDANLLKEEARIRLKRMQNNARRDRFLDARKRIIGVDVEALDAQVAEKRQLQSDNFDEDVLERLKAQEIDRILEEAKQEELQMRAYQQAEIKRSWEDAIKLRSAIKATPEPYLDPAKAGPSAAQNFAGSDPSRGERARNQKTQMRNWVQEQINEKAEIAAREKASADSYAQMLKMVEQIRDASDKEEAEMKDYLRKSVKESNNLLIAAKQNRQDISDAEWNTLTREQKANAASINLRENEQIAMDASGRITRRDAFRGYTDAQKRRIIQENEALLQRKREEQASGNRDEDIWVQQMRIQTQAMEVAQYAEQQMRESETKLNLEVLKQQIALQQKRRADGKVSRFGSVTSGFFDQFGTSCR